MRSANRCLGAAKRALAWVLGEVGTSPVAQLTCDAVNRLEHFWISASEPFADAGDAHESATRRTNYVLNLPGHARHGSFLFEGGEAHGAFERALSRAKNAPNRNLVSYRTKSRPCGPIPLSR